MGAAVDAGVGVAVGADVVGVSFALDVEGASGSGAAVDAPARPAQSTTSTKVRTGDGRIASTYTGRCRETPPLRM